MKCPECQFVCSELRDLCPRCQTDMRAFKKSMGLPVSYPKATYEELLIKAGKIKAPQRKEAAGAAPSILSLIKETFSTPQSAPTKTTRPPAPPASSPIPAARGKEAARPTPPSFQKKEITLVPPEIPPQPPQAMRPLPETQKKPAPNIPPIEIKKETRKLEPLPETKEIKLTEPLPVSPIETEPTEQIAEPRQFETVEAEPITTTKAMPETAKPVVKAGPEVLDLSGYDSDLSGILDKLIGESDIKVEPVMPAKAPPIPEEAKEPKQAKEVLVTIVTKERALSTRAVQVEEEQPQLLDKPTRPLVSFIESLPILEADDENSGFFASAFLDTLQAEENLELSAEQFAPSLPKEEISAYFDLAMEAINNPEVEKRYVKDFKISEKRQVDASDLASQLSKLEKRMSTQHISLKGAGAHGHAAVTESAELPPPESAPCSRRLLAFCIDCLVILAISTIGAVSIFAFSTPFFIEMLVGEVAFDAFDYVSLISWLSALFVTFSFLYPLFSVAYYGNTEGMRISRLSVVSNEGRKGKLVNVFLRSASLPLSNLCFGFLPALWGNRALHDRLARTYVVKSAL